MYAIVKTGGKQYKVAPGDKLNIEKLDAAVGDKVELEAICVVDGAKVEADPAKAAATKVTASSSSSSRVRSSWSSSSRSARLQEAARPSPAAHARPDRVRRLGQG